MSDPVGLESRRSANSVDDTVEKFRAAAEAAGLTIFADIDHGRNAVEVGQQLRPTRLIVFGNPKAGTGLMQARQTTGIDLPFKILVWEDEAGVVWLGWNMPRWIAERHGLAAGIDAILQAMEAGIERLASAATGP